MKQKLHFLDGLRGLAALYVALFHAAFGISGRSDVAHFSLLNIVLFPLTFGHYSVGIFIVLSGFLLTLPVAQTGELRGGLVNFLKRRAHRILPPYYVALLLFFGAGMIPAFYNPKVDASIYPMTKVCLLTHVFMVHNFRDAWIFKIDGPMWSLATEFQIYCVFALLLLPVYKRLGILYSVLLAIVIGLTVDRFHLMAKMSCPWYLALFAFGMAGAVFFTSERYQTLLKQIPFVKIWAGGTALFLLYLCVGFLRHKEWNLGTVHFLWAHDMFVGLLTVCLILHLGINKGSRIRSFLESRPLSILGGFSYSLYLYHSNIQIWMSLPIYRFHFSPWMEALWLFGVATPAAIAFSYGAYWLVERHFLNYPMAVPAVKADTPATVGAE